MKNFQEIFHFLRSSSEHLLFDTFISYVVFYTFKKFLRIFGTCIILLIY